MGSIQEADLMKDLWMSRFSISLNGQMLNCKARVLDPPAILIRGRPAAYQDRDPQLDSILG